MSCGTYDSPADVGAEPLAGGLRGLDELGAAVVAGLVARDERALLDLSITHDEYTGRLFPALVNHPSAEALGRDLLWDMHVRQSEDDLRRALDRHGGADLMFIRLEPRGTSRRAGVTFHERPRLIVRDAVGRERSLTLLASVIEHDATGTFKLLGYRDHD